LKEERAVQAYILLPQLHRCAALANMTFSSKKNANPLEKTLPAPQASSYTGASIAHTNGTSSYTGGPRKWKVDQTHRSHTQIDQTSAMNGRGAHYTSENEAHGGIQSHNRQCLEPDY
jgi:hypothetical protein